MSSMKKKLFIPKAWDQSAQTFHSPHVTCTWGAAVQKLFSHTAQTFFSIFLIEF